MDGKIKIEESKDLIVKIGDMEFLQREEIIIKFSGVEFTKEEIETLKYLLNKISRAISISFTPKGAL